MAVNPFEDQPQHYDDEAGESLDPAQQSLADALRVSFLLLKMVMTIVVIVYVARGIFSVGSQQVAVRLRFGDIVGDTPEQQVLTEGAHFALPSPFERVIQISTQEAEVQLENQFFFQRGEADLGKTTDELAMLPSRPLNPTEDGSLLTGDANIIHATWTVKYRIGRRPDGTATRRW